MKGVAARYPAFNAERGRPIDLEQRINLCRASQQKATPFPFESKELLALTAYVGRQSRGDAIDITVDERTGPFSMPAAPSICGGRASSISPARSATTTIGGRNSPAFRSRRGIRPGIRSTGSNGRPSARCSGGCATA